MFIKSKNKTPLVRGVILAVLLTLMGASPAAAAVQTFNLVAVPFTKVINGESVPMWGFDQVNGATYNSATTCSNLGALNPAVPGPRINIASNRDVLRIRLLNCLPVPTSIGINGLAKAMTPQKFVGGPFDGRIRSLDVETAPGARHVYEWTATGQIPAGTYMYRSVSHQQVQVPMGLYGAVTQEHGPDANKEAYPGYFYNTEKVLVYSEVDPALNAKVAADAADGVMDGTPVDPTHGGYTSTFNYEPKYFLLTNGSGTNGTHRAYTRSGNVMGGAVGTNGGIDSNQNLLLRMVNAGLRTIVPSVLGLRCDVIAEDASPYPFPRDQYSMEIWAGSTRDCMIKTPSVTANTIYPIIERRTTGMNKDGGQLIFFRVNAASGTPAPVAVNDPFGPIGEDSGLFSVAAPGVLGNDTGASLSASLVNTTSNGTLALAANGSFDYTPNPNFNGLDSFTYQANDGSQNSNVATVTINVTPDNDLPVAADNAYTVPSVLLTTIPAPGVLGNDSDIDGDTLNAVLGTTTAGGTLVLNADGSFDYTPNAGTVSDSFTYFANDGTGNSLAEATVDITVVANILPVAVADSLTVLRNSGANNVSVPGVLGNDSDADAGDVLTAVPGATTPTQGAVTLNVDGSYTYTPNTGAIGADSFSYFANDGKGNSNEATVSITIENNPPVAANDTGFRAPRNSRNGSSDAWLPVRINISSLTGNDEDVDGTINDASIVVGSPTTAGGTAVVVGTEIHYTGPVNFRGTDSFTYTVLDNDGAISNTATVSVNVTGRRAYFRSTGCSSSVTICPQ